MFNICELCGGKYYLNKPDTIRHSVTCKYYTPSFTVSKGSIKADTITSGSITINSGNLVTSPYATYADVVTSNRTYTYDELKMEIESSLGIQTTRKEEKIMNRSEAEALAAKAAEALAQVEKIEALFGKDDDYKDGDIIYAEIKFLDTRTTEPTKAQLRRYTTYNYAFIKANGYWYSSGPRAQGETFTWDRLIAWWSTVYIVKMRNVTKGSFKIKNNQVV